MTTPCRCQQSVALCHGPMPDDVARGVVGSQVSGRGSSSCLLHPVTQKRIHPVRAVYHGDGCHQWVRVVVSHLYPKKKRKIVNG
jgi:hypothetical protein